MAILFTCGCGKQVQAPEDWAGRRVRCPQCGRETVVPGGAASASPPQPPPVMPPPAPALEPRRPRYEEEADYGDRRRRPDVTEGTSGKAVTSLILGILSLICVPIITALIGLLLGFLALLDIGRSNGRLGGKGLAITGLALNGLGLVLGVVGLLLLIPLVQHVRGARDRMIGQNNLRQIGVGMHAYNLDKNHFPPPAIYSADGRPLLSWRVALLPYIEQKHLYDQFHLDEPWDSPHNKTLLSRMPTVYASPGTENEDPTLTYYKAIVGKGAAFEHRSGFVGGGVRGISLAEFNDGSSSTIMIVEAGDPVPWTKPEDITFDENGPAPTLRSPRDDGTINTLFADGSVRSIKDTIDPKTLRALMTRDGRDFAVDY